mmetsp:Transcript_13963/g.16862  ORF Transcript_13963/g.16862 Transcript_13963/m.16862 type:complete len:487 (-) Transcript_13963:457-1917(-)|eukprot:CAMPEP_0197852240 /NCGR_PEP_ID=MMETSP1438-20131217/20007_1 /TAXON_ID=1461541 /ORGANISM="Pterosperma sp., Strain CCMP1384" /LENGTH=486 /DNA_ID=CAMNT_0043466173 /DNA_START=92 /DNA_END=1552 /DNA_ORIENTATION=-
MTEGILLPYFTILTTYFSYALLFFFGRLRDFLAGYKGCGSSKPGYAAIGNDFYTRRLYRRIHDCWDRPICSSPDNWFTMVERVRGKGNEAKLKCTGETRRCLNLGSYNYLGFGSYDSFCTPQVIKSLQDYGPSMCSGRLDAGTTAKHVELEEYVAKFLNKEAAMVCGMGFATNSCTLPALISKGTLVISDSLNHTSIVNGVRGSQGKVKVFRHNDPAHLERVVRESIAVGQPRTFRPWKKILIVVEGIYSMEGEICRLAEIVEVKKKYKAYLYLDEAHSIGALGATGRGVCEHCGVDTADVDIMMGTFTKSFGSVGGYVAGSRDLINYLRMQSPGWCYSTSMSVPACQQVISALKVIEGKDQSSKGDKKLTQLKENSNWMRTELRKVGCEVLGDYDSPVMPLMLYNPAKIPAFSRECLKQNLAVVVVGFPATPLLLARARICISAAHTRKDLEYAVQVITEVAHRLGLIYNEKDAILAKKEESAAN